MIINIGDIKTFEKSIEKKLDDCSFFQLEERTFSGELDHWKLRTLEHTSDRDWEIVLAEIKVGDIKEFRIYSLIEDIGIDSRKRLLDSGHDWMFDGEGFTNSIEDSYGAIYNRKKKSEIYNGHDALVEYHSENGDPSEILIVEEGSINKNGGIVEFYDGYIIEDYEVKI